MPRLNILFVVSECVPYAKTGGLADVAGALPIALAERGHDVRVVMPRYRITKKHPARPVPVVLEVPVSYGPVYGGVLETTLPGSRAKVYFLEHNDLFDRDGIYGDSNGDFGDNLARYTFLSRGALELCKLLDFRPDVIHVHDWMTGLVPVYLDTLYRDEAVGQAASVLTVHNLAYQGWFGKDDLHVTGLGWETFLRGGLERSGAINTLQGGLVHATTVTTVSPGYASEIQTREWGEGMDGLLRARGDVLGILNGIDDKVWSPETDKHIAAHFSADDLTGKAICKADLQREMGLPQRPDVPLIGLVSRLVGQKGIDIFAEALHRILLEDVQIVVLGSGESWAENLFSRLSHSTPHFRAYLGMNEPLSHKIEAGADLFVMPSRYEPCGLNQMYSQRYGTLPIVRAVGGLDDTVDNYVTGFKFHELSGAALGQCVEWALHAYWHERPHFRAMQRRAMLKPMGWDHAARQYEAMFRLSMARRRGRTRY
ncbi:MAG: glycogen synthase GlgA [Polyangiaceae bacterium]